MEMKELGSEAGGDEERQSGAGAELRAHSDLELYVPPLTSMLLDSIYKEKAAARSLDAPAAPSVEPPSTPLAEPHADPPTEPPNDTVLASPAVG